MKTLSFQRENIGYRKNRDSVIFALGYECVFFLFSFCCANKYAQTSKYRLVSTRSVEKRFCPKHKRVGLSSFFLVAREGFVLFKSCARVSSHKDIVSIKIDSCIKTTSKASQTENTFMNKNV